MRILEIRSMASPFWDSVGFLLVSDDIFMWDFDFTCFRLSWSWFISYCRVVGLVSGCVAEDYFFVLKFKGWYWESINFEW